MTKPQYQLHVRKKFIWITCWICFENVLKLLVIWNKGEIQENESIIYDSSVFLQAWERLGTGFADECGSGYQPDAYHISGMEPYMAVGIATFLMCTCQCSVCVYLWKNKNLM